VTIYASFPSLKYPATLHDELGRLRRKLAENFKVCIYSKAQSREISQQQPEIANGQRDFLQRRIQS
jgi:hypothetical protein